MGVVPYLFVMMIPAILAQVNQQRISLFYWVLSFSIFVFFIGFRFEVGPDWHQYFGLHHMMLSQSLSDVLVRAEPLSSLLFWLSIHAGAEVYITNIFAAFVLIYGVYSFAARTPNPWLAIVSATPYFVLVTGMSGVRQIIAAGIMLYLMSKWERVGIIRRFVTILIAALFHTSALANSIFIVTQLNIMFRYKILLGLVILGITFFLGTELPVFAENMMVYQQRYIEKVHGGISYGSLYHISMILFPAILAIIFRRRIYPYIHYPKLMQFGIYASLAIFVLNFFSTTAASRFTLYFYFVPMMAYPALTCALGPRLKPQLTALFIAQHILILLVWFTLGNHKDAYIPYQNILF